MKRSGEDEIGTINLKSDIYDAFLTLLACDHSKIITLYTSYITKVYFTLNLFTIHVVIIKGAVTDIRYFARSKFSRNTVRKKNFSLI